MIIMFIKHDFISSNIIHKKCPDIFFSLSLKVELYTVEYSKFVETIFYKFTYNSIILTRVLNKDCYVFRIFVLLYISRIWK